MKPRPKRIWFLMAPRTGLLNVAGPWEVFGHTNDVLGYAAYETSLLGPRAPAVPTGHGIVLGNVQPLPERLRRTPDVVIVAGAPRLAPYEVNEQLVPWIRRFHSRIPTIVSICTGAFVLARAGLLDGRRATTHWMFLDAMRAEFPNVQVVDEGIYVKDGHIWTSAGVTAGIDLTLALVEADHGHQVAMAVAKRLVLFLRRSGNQAQFSAALQRQGQEAPKLRDVSTFVLENVDKPLPVSELAHALGMSPRTLSRWCREQMGESPAEVIRRVRVDEARRLLEETSLPLKDVIARTGFGDASTLWRAFTQRLGVTPAEYRERFQVTERAVG